MLRHGRGLPRGIGLALVLGVVVNYVSSRSAIRPAFRRRALVVVAILLDAVAYRRLTAAAKASAEKELMLSVACGILMGFFYRFVADSMSMDFSNLEAAKMGPYAAVFVFSIGVLLSNFVFVTYLMKKPLSRRAAECLDYFKGDALTHGIGVLGGVIWASA